MQKTRLITIQRTVEETVTDKHGNVTVQKVKHWFPCHVNAATPFDHHICQ